MAYTKRYAGGFVDKPSTTTPIDSTFLNNVESALLTLFGVTPLTNGALIWDGSKFTAASKIVNANIDSAAAIDKTKLGTLGIVDADVASGAAIARSKLNFGSGLVDADVATGAAINAAKLTGISAAGTITVSGSNTDIAWAWGRAASVFLAISPGGGSLRNIGAPTAGAGTLLSIRNYSTAVTVLYTTAGGGQQIAVQTGTNFILHAGQDMQLVYDGSVWLTAGSSTNVAARLEAGTSTAATGATVTFPRAFTGVLAVLLAPTDGGGYTPVVTASSITTTQFAYTTGTGVSKTISWLAVGY